jgi:hypothetical protein
MSTALANQDFTAEDNVAGQTLLRLVSRGSAIIAELLRLSDHVPQIFTPRSDKQQARLSLLFAFNGCARVEIIFSSLVFFISQVPSKKNMRVFCLISVT